VVHAVRGLIWNIGVNTVCSICRPGCNVNQATLNLYDLLFRQDYKSCAAFPVRRKDEYFRIFR